MRSFHTKGLILRARNFGESGKIVTILTPVFGKIEARAHGARRILSHFTGHLEPLSICDFALYKSTKGTLTITQCKTAKTFKKIRGSLELMAKALEITEFLNLNTALEQPLEKSFETVERALENLESAPEKAEKIFEAYIREVLNILGLLPHKKITKKELKEIIEKYVITPQSSFSTHKTPLIRSSLSRILSN